MAIIIGGGSGNAISINSTVGTATSIITSDGTNAYWGSGDFVIGATQTVYTAPGTWTKPATVTTIKVTVVGGGAAGGTGAGGGAGGGGTAIRYLQAPAIPGPVAVTAGAGTNSFGAFASATAGSVGGPSPGASAPGGAGGVGSSGDINIRGGAGSYGEGGSILAGYGSGGMGGSSTMGGGGKGAAPSPGPSPSAGNPGNNYGGGGGGGTPASTGAPGIVIVEAYS
jgi:hypothetical protein